MSRRVVPILSEVRWEPNAPNESFEHDQDGFAAIVLRPHPDDADTSSIVIFWSEAESASFGPPNDEDRHEHPLYGAGLDALLWAGEVLDDGETQPSTRHFVVPTKEGLAEVRARQINWARLPEGTSAGVAIEYLKSSSQPARYYPTATVDGFTIGTFASYGEFGDAWVEAPDGGIATLIWVSGDPAYCRESIPPDPAGRWGTYAVQLNLPMTTDDEAAAYLHALLPDLIPRWTEWNRSR